jgi:pyrimidine deaminase RibD-like protein
MNESTNDSFDRLIGLVRNHALSRSEELEEAAQIECERRSIVVDEAHGSKGELARLFQRLRSLVEQIVQRETNPEFEGVPLRWLERAEQLARSSLPEDDGARPKVGAVILRNGQLIAEASRNQDGIGGHAEQLAIETCKAPELLEGATVLTTLEPCTHRGTRGRRPCSEMLLRYGIKKVLIGLPDPNPAIRGRGDILLRRNGLSVGYFPIGLASRLWTLNDAFVHHFTQDDFRQIFLYKS